MPDPLTAAYATLGLAPGATEEEIKRAWRKTARATHPDLHPDDPDAARRFKVAEAAHALLTDPARRARAAAEAGRPRRDGPDDDWIDTCAWIAEAHYIRLRRDVLPRYAARFRGGPSLSAALASAAQAGLAEGAPDDVPSRWARAWAWATWRRVELVVHEGFPLTRGPVGLLREGGRLRIYLWPRALWDAGVRDEEALRRIVRMSVDLGVATAAPMLFGLPSPEAEPPADADRKWWAGQLLWPAVLVFVVLFSVFLIGTAMHDANTPRAIPEQRSGR